MEKEKVSPDSSTHIAAKRKKSRKRKEKDSYKERKRAKKQKASKDTSSIVSDSGSKKGNFKKKKGRRKSSKSPIDDDDAELDIKPLSSYVDDRQELHKQLFTIISKKELKGMLPLNLKKLEAKEIKKLCYDQLEILSRKRLQHIIAGEEMVSSTSSSSDDEESNSKQNGQSVCCPESSNRTRQEPAVESVKLEEGKKSSVEDADLNIFQEMIIAPNQDEIDELIEGNVKQDATNEDGMCDSPEERAAGAWEQGEEPEEEDADETEEAELKMLEFRARALKSLVLARERQMKQKAAQPK